MLNDSYEKVYPYIQNTVPYCQNTLLQIAFLAILPTGLYKVKLNENNLH